MDLNELQSVQSRERQTDSLQQLRATFYQDAADFIQELEAERDAAAERADDPWNAPEVGRLNDDIDTAKGTVEAIYERRVGKIVKIASLAAADMPTDDEGLTEEEQALFDQLVAAIERNREGVFAVLDGEDPAIDPTDVPDPTGTSPPAKATGTSSADPSQSSDTSTSPAEAQGEAGGSHREVPPDVTEPGEGRPTEEPAVDAADLMVGDSGDENPEEDSSGVDYAGTTDTEADTQLTESSTEESGSPIRDGGVGAQSTETAAESTVGDTGVPDDVDRSMVRITDDVGPIYGVEGREYDLTADDVVTLPEANVGPLLRQGAAERLD